jgi:hypothetical protein
MLLEEFASVALPLEISVDAGVVLSRDLLVARVASTNGVIVTRSGGVLYICSVVPSVGGAANDLLERRAESLASRLHIRFAGRCDESPHPQFTDEGVALGDRARGMQGWADALDVLAGSGIGLTDGADSALEWRNHQANMTSSARVHSPFGATAQFGDDRVVRLESPQERILRIAGADVRYADRLRALGVHRLPDGFIQTVADASSDTRFIIRYDLHGTVVSVVRIEFPVGVLATLARDSIVVMTRRTDQLEIVWYQYSKEAPTGGRIR